ncbi:EF-P 5-aminopentanol modification-associated protein YfmH [Streptococcus ovis]|uniref:EF-P 5-aminopentanol modification-associated protein YfmH n=1 Tax=Streptococcus ovis TaxID=82806 RepID=UPI0003646C95|nr:pitrilysin family protein [Streptococcus ovis]
MKHSNGLTESNYFYLESPLFTGKLTNGLTVYLQNRKDFHETYVTLSVHFGAAHTHLKLNNSSELSTYPAGVAHFLEHKLFEGKNGTDFLQEFSKMGAYANAYTGLYQTTYLFSTTENISTGLILLRDLVKELTVSEESVEREREIIGQEIDMYYDDPDSRLYAEILASLYPSTPLANDIAGSRFSIQEISPDVLHEQFRLFYHPQNMVLFVVGDVDITQMWQEIQTIYSDWQNENSLLEAVPMSLQPVLEHRTITLEVASPKLAIGIRGKDAIAKEDLFRYRLSLSLLFSMLCGWTSKRYQNLYQQGKIDASLSFHLGVSEQAHFWVLTVDTSEPIALSSVLRKAIRQFESDPDVNEEHLALVKREAYGDFLRGLNSLENLASNFTASIFDSGCLFDIPDLLDDIELEEIIEIGRRFIGNCDMTDFTIFPK